MSMRRMFVDTPTLPSSRLVELVGHRPDPDSQLGGNLRMCGVCCCTQS